MGWGGVGWGGVGWVGTHSRMSLVMVCDRSRLSRSFNSVSVRCEVL